MCNYCKDDSEESIIDTKEADAYIYKDNLQIESQYYRNTQFAKIYYCPMCGRQLKEV